MDSIKREIGSSVLLAAIVSMKDKIAKIQLDPNIPNEYKEKQIWKLTAALKDTQRAAILVLYKELGDLIKSS